MNIGEDKLNEILDELKEDIRERFVRQEEFKDYKQRLQEKFAFTDKQHAELKKDHEDHEVRISLLESKIENDVLGRIEALTQLQIRTKTVMTQRQDDLDAKLKDCHA
jgi:hypothetical protein